MSLSHRFFSFFSCSRTCPTPLSTMTSFLSAITTPTYPLWHEWLTSLAGFPTMLRHVHSFEEYLFSFSLSFSLMSFSHISQMFLILSSCSTIHLCFLSSIHPPFSSVTFLSICSSHFGILVMVGTLVHRLCFSFLSFRAVHGVYVSWQVSWPARNTIYDVI